MLFFKAITFIDSLENADEIKRTMNAALLAKRMAARKDGSIWVINIPGTTEDHFPGHAWTDLLEEYLEIEVDNMRCSTCECDIKLEGREKKGAHVLALSKSADNVLYGNVCIVPVCSECNSSKKEPYQVSLDRIATRDELMKLGICHGWQFNDITKKKQ